MGRGGSAARQFWATESPWVPEGQARTPPFPTPPGGGGQGPAGVVVCSPADGCRTSTKGGVVWHPPAQTRGQATRVPTPALPVVALPRHEKANRRRLHGS